MTKSYFYVGICLLVLFEIANVYFIMPMPFSQRARARRVRPRWMKADSAR